MRRSPQLACRCGRTDAPKLLVAPIEQSNNMALMVSQSLAIVAATAASGVVSTPRSGPELSDVALFLVAAVAVWLTRRALRNRGRKG